MALIPDLTVKLSFASLAAILRLSVFVLDVIKDVFLTVHQQRLPCHTYNRSTKENSSC